VQILGQPRARPCVLRADSRQVIEPQGKTMRENHLRKLFSEGKSSFATRVQTAWPTVTELIGRSGQFDYVEFLAEYAPYTLHDLDNLGRAIELSPNFCGMIKIEQSAQWHLAVRAMSAGFQNVLFTDVRTADDAREIVRIVRAEGPGNDCTHGLTNGRIPIDAPAQFVQYYADAIIAIMIEKRAAFENLDAILAVPGIDMVQFGPGDYGMSIGKANATYGGGLHPEVREAREICIKRTLAAGLRPRAEIGKVEEVDYYLDLGVRDFCLSSDMLLLKAFYKEQGLALRERVAGRK
jgi:2-keto-3-deoxy-L-rhamnonate aldolase RhmA